MSKVPDAWEDEWSTVADSPAPAQQPESPKKTSSKVTKAQRRAQQAEFNRQLWVEAEGPKETNHFLESRNVVPLRQEYKPPPILLSRKGPIIQKPRSQISENHAAGASTTAGPSVPTEILSSLNSRAESSDDEDDETNRKPTLAERQAQAAKDREVKQRKYEERRLELFGPPTPQGSNSGLVPGPTTANHPHHGNSNNNKSGTSSPGSATPPHSRSSTPSNRGGGRRGGANRGRGTHNAHHNISNNASTNYTATSQLSRSSMQTRDTNLGQHQHQNQMQYQQQQQQLRELYDPAYMAKPDSSYIMQHRRMDQSQNQSGMSSPTRLQQQQRQEGQIQIQQPIRVPKGPDGSGRGGFGFVTSRGGVVAESLTEEN